MYLEKIPSTKLTKNSLRRTNITMSDADEARYGRVCFLVLNVCPFTLRQVINNYYIRHGSHSLQDFLEKHKHDIYHLWKKKCCCRSRQSKDTAINKSQWDRLYIRNTSPCGTGHGGDCPCQYDARPGVTTDIMDVTLCCLVITRLCHGINMSHIDTIREVRNNVIHAERASLDKSTFYSYWNKVQTAIIDLANHVSHCLRTDTFKMVKDLEGRVMNYEEFKEMRNFIVEQERMKEKLSELDEKLPKLEEDSEETHLKLTDLQDSVDQTAENVIQIQDSVNQTTETVTQVEDNLNQITEKVENMEDNVNQRLENVEKLLQCKETDESDVQRLNQRLLDINENTTQEVPLSPVQVDGDTLPIEQLFCSVVIKEDSKETTKKKGAKKDNYQQEQREVRTAEDLLTKDGKPVSNIFMLGDAAHGKTTYCLWLLKMWCNFKQRAASSKPFNEWEKALGQFDFVFDLKLRHVDRSRANVIDMICHDLLGRDTVLQAAAKHVLHDDKYRCFIIMDGLDEWKPNQTVLEQLKYRGFPNIDNMSNCVIFTTMRSWVFSEMAAVVRRDDRVIEIKGLDDKGIRNVIEKVLEHYYEMKPSSEEYKLMLKDMTSKLGNETLKSFIKIPLLAVVCVQIWYSGEQVGDSLTSFYIALINMLIQRAHLKHKTQNEMFEATHHNLPTLLSAKENIKNYFGALFKLGEVAYGGLLTGQMKLVFPRVYLEAKLGKRELRFALDVGLISQRGTHFAIEEMVSVNFFHKSVQEFLAAVYAVTNWDKIDPFCKQLTNVNVIMNLANVIMFICGMCPSLGSEISQRVVNVTDCDTEICEYRGKVNPHRNIKVIELYKQQASWYREFTNGHTHSPLTFHVSDVRFSDFDTETMRITRKLFLDPFVTMRSLDLFDNYTDEDTGLPDIQGNFLANEDNTRSMVMLNITCFEAHVRSVFKICGSSLRIINLDYVRIQQPDPPTAICPPLLSNLSQLRILKLWGVTIGDRLLGLTPEMVHLEEIRFYKVRMSTKSLRTFMSSLIEIEHTFKVDLDEVGFDTETIQMVSSSPHFSPLPHLKSKVLGEDSIMCIKVWPPRRF